MQRRPLHLYYIGRGLLVPPLNLIEDLADKILVHVNKNYIVGFVFEHSFE